MSLFAIADLHLSLGTDKPMDVFHGWTDYVERLKANWERLVTDGDTVVIAGDISWAMKLEDCDADFSFINALPGQKILLKGNHDYWWQTKKKLDDYLADRGFDSIRILFNNAYQIEGRTVCGTRGWYYDKEGEHDIKVINREIGRLKLSYAEAKRLCDASPPIVFLHYPPVYGDIECEEIMTALLELGVKECYYGHLHGERTHKNAVIGEYKGITFHLIAADYTRFVPVPVR
ncbi:MAG: metallophosphoesterase [Ruminococcus sp.]|nr:metallophosphoesterase [Ruminococcus sp.]